MRLLILLVIFFAPVLSYSQNYLLSNEKIVFEFETMKGKLLVVAIDTTEEYLVYRFGTKENIEFEFPDDLSTSWDNFKFSWYLRGGGIQNEGLDLNYLYFDIKDFRYVVFQEYSAHIQKTNSGIKVINQTTQKETIFKANPTTVKGSLSDFRYMNLLKEGDQLFE